MPSNSIKMERRRVLLLLSLMLFSCAGLIPCGRAQELRLPRTVLPQLYEISLLPNLVEGDFSTEGTVSILLYCNETTNAITLHIADTTYSSSTVSVKDMASNSLLGIANVEETKATEFLTVTTREQLVAGQQYRLEMNFTSYLNSELRGFYRSTYTENGETKYLAVSQMQPTDARRAFPCFDEPNMKANFSIKLGRKSSQKSTSNMPIIGDPIPIAGKPDYFWDVFETSLPVSTYLVGMMVSEFVYVDSPAGLSDTPFRIWARPDAISQTEYASRIGPQVLNYYEDYFGIKFPLPKQDMLALPELSFGGMENWGMITYRETALLYDPEKSSESDKTRVAVVIAHELAHQWFGDLVTMDWWSDLWLNEGFASYMEYVGVDQVEPGFEILPQIVIDDVQTVFAVDALESSHPISVVVNDPNEINELFDSISYSKGASIIRMLNRFLGEDTFRKGLTNYLDTKKYGNAVQNDLWSALTAQATLDNVGLPVDVRTIMDTWTLKMGYPVVTVTRDYSYSSATITQERFLLRKSASSNDTTVYQWWIPLTYTANFDEPQTSIWFSDQLTSRNINLNVPANQWVIFNVDEVGYYRVNYDLINWQLIVNQTLSDFNKISRINRAQLLDDSLNIARANKLRYSVPLDLTQYLVGERDYIPWKSATNGLSYIQLMFVRAAGYGDFKLYMKKLVEPLYDYVSFNDGPEDSHLLIYTRGLAVTWACSLDIGDCVSNSTNLYKEWMDKPTDSSIIPVNLKQTITCTAIANGGEAEWNFAFQLYLDTNVAAESTKLLYGLSCSQDTATLSKLLEMSLDPTSGIRRSDASSVFRNVASNSYGRDIVFNFLVNRWTEMVAFFPTLGDLAKIVDTVAEGFNTQEEVDQLKQLKADHIEELGTAARAFDQSIERAEANVEWMTLHYKEVLDWLNPQPETDSGMIASFNFLILLFVSLIHYFLF